MVKCKQCKQKMNIEKAQKERQFPGMIVAYCICGECHERQILLFSEFEPTIFDPTNPETWEMGNGD